MGQAHNSEKQRVWDQLSKAGLIDIPGDQFPERIKEAKKAVMQRLDELLEVESAAEECDSAAYSLATLKKLEATLRRKDEPEGSA